jgi:hypothetical protein
MERSSNTSTCRIRCTSNSSSPPVKASSLMTASEWAATDTGRLAATYTNRGVVVPAAFWKPTGKRNLPSRERTHCTRVLSD